MSVNFKKLFVFFMVIAVLCSFCTAAFADEETHEEPDKKAILIASFGTSMPEAKKGIDNLVEATKNAFPDFEVRVAYTSNIIRRKIAKEQSVHVPTPAMALAALNDEHFTHVYVMPTHIIPGEEYDAIKSIVSGFRHMFGKYAFKELKIGKPFLCDIPHTEKFADLLLDIYVKELEDKDNKIVLMGHGTPEHIANALYTQLQLFLNRKAPGRFYIGTVEVAPLVEDVVKSLNHAKAKKIVLAPLMIVAGDHANNDMADEEDPESWVSIFKSEGYKKIDVRIKGLGEYKQVADLFVEHIKDAMD